MKGKPNEEVYRLKKAVLGEFEQMSRDGLIDLYYGDEAGALVRAECAVWLAVLG